MATEIISGVNPIFEAMRAGRRKVEKIWIADKQEGGLVRGVLELALKKRVPVSKASRQQLFELSRIEKNQGIIARVSQYKYARLEDVIRAGRADSKGHFILVLDNVIDPQNFGSIIRTAHLTGVQGIIIQERNSASVGPASTRASAGAVEYMPIVKVTNIVRTLKLLKKEGVWIVGIEAGGENLYSQVLSGSYAFVVGGEGKGVRRLVKEECDHVFSIPMNPISGGVGSYNVSAAAAILLSEVNRQRGYI